MLRAHRYEEPGALPDVAGLPDEIAELCRRCLAKAPDERPTSAEVAVGLAEAAGIPVPVSPAGRTAPSTALLPKPAEPGTTILPGRALALPTTAAVTGAAPRALRRSRVEAVLIAAGLLLVSGLVWASTGDSDAGSVLAAPVAGVGAAQRSCRVEYRTDRDSGAAFTADVTVTNTAAEPVDDWRLEFELTGDQRVTATTSAAWEQSGRMVVVRSTGADRRLEPGASARLTLAGAYRRANPLPLAFGLNDDPCEAVVVGALGASSVATTGGTGAGVQMADRGGNSGRGKSGHGSDGKGDGGSDRGGKDKD
jgi:serine/threonine-protein kinase